MRRTGPIQDLREWLERVEGIGDLVHVTQPVSIEEEMSAIGYLVAKQNPSPAILFDNSERLREQPDQGAAPVEYSRSQSSGASR